MKNLFWSFILLFFTQNLFAQDWEWFLEADYEKVQFLENEDIFIIENNFESAALSLEGEILFTKAKDYLNFSPAGVIINPQKKTSQGLILYKEDEKYGFINLKGEVIIPAEYEGLSYFSEGLAAFKKDEKYGYINAKAEVVIPAEYDLAHSFSEGLALISYSDSIMMITAGESFYVPKDNNYYFIDKTGQKVIDVTKYNYVSSFKNGVAFGNVPIRNTAGYQMYSKQMMFDKTGKILNSRYNTYVNFQKSFNLIPFSNKKLYGYLNTKGEIKIPSQFYSVQPFSEGLAAVGIIPEEHQNNVRIGFIDEKGEWLIEPQFGYMNAFSEGIAIGNDTLDYSGLIAINTEGEVLYTFEKNYNATKFENGYLIVSFYDPDTYEGYYTLFNKNFEYVFENYFEEILPATEGLFIVKENGKYGIIRVKEN